MAKSKRNKDSRRVQRILAELKKRKKRNIKKQRGGPHMRGFWLLLLLKKMIGEDDYEDSLFIGIE